MLRKVPRRRRLSLLLGSLYTLKCDCLSVIQRFRRNWKSFVFNRLSLVIAELCRKFQGLGIFWASRIQLYFEKRGQLADFRTPLALKTKQFGERKSVAVPFFTRGLIHRYQHSAYRAPWIFGLAADTC